MTVAVAAGGCQGEVLSAAELVDFDAEEGRGSPHGDGPWSRVVSNVQGICVYMCMRTYMPQTHMRIVADTKLLANGAIIMAEANIKSPIIHAVSRSGFILSSFSSNLAIALGGRGVNVSSVGDRTIMGRKKAPAKLTAE